MALSPRNHQKKIERRKAKEKSKQQALKQRSQRLEEQATQAIPTAPILHCYASSTIWDQGLGHVLISRVLPDRRVAFAMFLLDLYCLGVKDAMFDIGERGHYDRQMYGRMTGAFATVTLEPACARKLIEGGVAYARDLGLPPHPDYNKAKLIFGDTDPQACERTFVYGKDGKPFFVAGPNDNSERCTRIIRTLSERYGPDGFHYLLPIAPAGSAPPGGRMLQDGR